MITIQNLSYSVGGKPVISALNWSIPAGQHALVLGASGSGKTTLLHLLAGLLTPEHGSVLVDGQDVHALQGSARDAWRGAAIGMVFQTLHLVQALSVRDNLRLARWTAKKPANDARITEVLASLGLADKAQKFPHELSVGEAQRVAIARAVVHEPKWIFADEPTSALDDANCATTLALLEAQAKACGATLVISTHDQRIKSRYTHTLELTPMLRNAA